MYITLLCSHILEGCYSICVSMCVSHAFGSSLFAVVVIIHQVQLEFPAGYSLLCWLSLEQVAITAVSL